MERIAKQPKERRSSTRREIILALLIESKSFLSSQEIHKLLSRQEVSIGLATVYRQLEGLVEQGRADAIVSPSGERLYRHCGQAETHHHHIICRVCGAATELDFPEVEIITQTYAKRYKYKSVTHSLEIFGVCLACDRLQSSSIKSRRKPKLS
ncbi:MAG: transcriptional repressor [Phycisphaerae bacterium]|nr:transcriptional repressor [Phycisphaerae bacterium]